MSGSAEVVLDKCLVSTKRSGLENNNDSVWVQLCCKSQEHILISVFYISPQVTTDELMNYLINIEEKGNKPESYRYLFSRDFSIPGIDWTNLNNLSNNVSTSRK